MGKKTSTIGRYFRASTAGQRRAAYIVAILSIALLLAAIAFVVVSDLGLIRPVATNAAQQQYLRARDAETQGIAAAQTAGAEIDTFPAVITARLSIVQAQLAMGQNAAATRLVDSIVRANPDNVRALIVQGNVLEVAGDNGRALDAYRSAFEYAPAGEPELQREALRGIGNCLVQLGDSVQAFAMLSQAAFIPPESTTLHLAAAKVAFDLENWQDAAHHYYSVLIFDSDNEVALEQIEVLERDHSIASQAAQEQLAQRMRQSIPDQP